MSKKVGPLALGKREEPIFLGREISRTRDYSEKTAEQIDAEMRRIVEEAYAKARQIIQDKREGLQTIAEALLERETLNGEQIAALLAGRSLPELVEDSGSSTRGRASSPATEPAGNDAEGGLIGTPGLSTEPEQA